MRDWDTQGFARFLRLNERSENTVAKYVRDIDSLRKYAGNRDISRELVLEWRQYLLDAGYKPRSINSMIAAVNSYDRYIGRPELSVKAFKIQKSSYRQDSDELTREEYFRLVRAASMRPRMQLIIQTICSTGIRVSELSSFTVEAVRAGEVIISNKGKIRVIMIPGRLRERIIAYIDENNIESGAVFRSRSGRPVERSTIWHGMKSLCSKADIEPRKVYPHNLRKLFAREFYAVDKDLSKLADVLGHSNIETTRIYIMGTGKEHRELIDKLGLVL